MGFFYSADDPLHPENLKGKQRDLREGFADPLSLRVHRALSWLRRAEGEGEDPDLRFLLLWIGFNAVYAGDISQASGPDARKEREAFLDFFRTLVSFDGRHRIYNTLWERYSQEVRVMLDNPYIFAPFWLHHNGVPGYANWEQRLERGHHDVNVALKGRDTATLLSLLFDRLYVLRNQLVHGGATWNSAVNRDQLRDGGAMLGCLLPIFIDLMMDYPDHEWPMPHYPVLES